jgi:hypothetical protein
MVSGAIRHFRGNGDAGGLMSPMITLAQDDSQGRLLAHDVALVAQVESTGCKPRRRLPKNKRTPESRY